MNQGNVGTSFATLTLAPSNGGTQFTLDTALSGGMGNPSIVELLFGCNGCSTNVSSVPTGATVDSGGTTQAGYNWDFSVSLDPGATQANTLLTWIGDSSPATYLEFTSGAGPDAFAMIQLTGGMESINGVNIESGFYVATGEGGLPPIPEPETYAMLLAGLGIVGFMVRRLPAAKIRHCRQSLQARQQSLSVSPITRGTRQRVSLRRNA